VDERDWPEELDRRTAAVATSDDPYAGALEVTNCVADHLVTSVIASRLYQVWTALQERLELKAGKKVRRSLRCDSRQLSGSRPTRTPAPERRISITGNATSLATSGRIGNRLPHPSPAASTRRTGASGSPGRTEREWVWLSSSAADYICTMAEDAPQNWRLDVSDACIDLYRELSAETRRLSKDEAQMMVELVDAWRALEHRKHIALESALSDRGST
jgi:hypothetical protein